MEQGDRARLEVDKVKHSLKEKEKSQFSSSNQMISTFASQLREFETRESQYIQRTKDKFAEVQQMIANGSIDAQKNQIKFEKDFKRNIFGCIEKIESRLKETMSGSKSAEVLF